MISITDPRQETLFDPFEHLLSKQAHDVIQNGWQGVFRHVILELLPAETVAEKFHEFLGRPTKELYSVAGLILIMEFQDWTKEKAVEAYMCHVDVWYALNMGPGLHGMCVRTLERYQKIFREEELAQVVMRDVTMRLVERLELDISKQRLDSTHVFSDMANFGRTRMMGVTIKRFLTQVKRHDRAAYDALPEELLERYRTSAHQLFGDAMKNKEQRGLLRQQVAEDMHALIEGFADNDRVNGRETFKLLCTVFEQQCEIVDKEIQVEETKTEDTKTEDTKTEDTKTEDSKTEDSKTEDSKTEDRQEKEVKLKAKTGGNVIQNPSDPDATYDAHKGCGYQTQLSETCSEDNEVQLITSVIPETAVTSDAKAPEAVLGDLRENGLLPGEILADAAYGSDENVLASAAEGVELVAPVFGNTPKGDTTTTIGDFKVDAQSETIEACPAGHTPISSEHNPETGRTHTKMDPELCAGCPLQAGCPIKQTRNGAHIEHTEKERRLDERRRDEKTDEFRERYNRRSGIEATNSGIKRRTGMDRLRVRGQASVFHAIVLKVTGWNILQAARATKMKEYVARKMKRKRQTAHQAPNQASDSGYVRRRWLIMASPVALRRLLPTQSRVDLHGSILCAA